LAQFFCQSLLVLTKSLSEKQWKPRLAPKRLMALDRL
jgi:hypothetical protein